MEELTLDTLLLTNEELSLARHHIAEKAYMKWQEAGQPSGRSEEFWKEAELEWIKYCYVPDRMPQSCGA